MRISRSWRNAAAAVLASAAVFAAAAIPAEAATGSFPSAQGAYGLYNVRWGRIGGYDMMYGGGGSSDGSGTKDSYSNGLVSVFDHTSSHFPVSSAVSTINSYLVANSNKFRLSYLYTGTGSTCNDTYGPCVDVYETQDPMAVLGKAVVSGGFCSLSLRNTVTMSWPNMYQYSTTARKGAVMHEIYHAIGLPHSSNTNDIMYSGAGEPASPTTGINRATPSANDSTTVSLLYGRWGASAGYACNP